MAQCAQCMFDNAKEATACEQCGADLTVEVLSLQLGEVCRNCDSYNDPGVRVCVSCGQALSSEGPTEEMPAPFAAEPVAVPPSLAPAPQPWLAPPDTGEFKQPFKQGEFAPQASRPVEVTAATPGPRTAASALPPSALPPGFGGGGPKPATIPGRALQETPVTCPRCRANNPPSARYCGTCGNGLLPQPSAAIARGKLILIRGTGQEGKQFPLYNTASAAGRSDGAVTFPEDPYVGSLHATFSYRGDDLVIKDEGALNGVYVRLREAQALRPGDMFNIGERLLRYGGAVAFPSAAAGRHGSPRTADRLQVIEEIVEGGSLGRVCKRAGPSITIGRAGCDLNFPMDGFVSARHAELSIAGETAFLRDLGSANGTFLRVQPRSERVLTHGDYLLIGRELLRVEVASAR